MVLWRPKALRRETATACAGRARHLLGPIRSPGWENDVNRQAVVVRRTAAWYNGQVFTGDREGRAVLGLATSQDGIHWERFSDQPVLVPDAPWEQSAVMCPHVLWDEGLGLYRLWYSGGEIYEPDAIGYATSPDGVHWTKHPGNPVFTPDRTCAWEREKVTACQVLVHRGWHLMFYIGFRDVDHAQIGLARSRDGITGWQRHPANPIISPTGADGITARSTSPSPCSTVPRAAGASGTTAAAALSNRLVWPCTKGKTWGSRDEWQGRRGRCDRGQGVEA
jgi:predicted GH43/DUF377 family glycosyl hydrolase